MSALLATLLLATASAAPEGPPPEAAVQQLSRGVTAHRMLHGSELRAEAMQEAWCLVLEHHPEVWSMTDADVRSATVQVARRDGRLVDLPLETRLLELGIKARNTVLKDNHLSRQTAGLPARFTDYDDAVADPLDRRGRRVPPVDPDRS